MNNRNKKQETYSFTIIENIVWYQQLKDLNYDFLLNIFPRYSQLKINYKISKQNFKINYKYG